MRTSEHPGTMRYNELFTTCYPWDIHGIEMGHACWKTQTEEFVNKITSQRSNLASYYEGIISNLADYVKSSMHKNWTRLDGRDYLLYKFLQECKCGGHHDEIAILQNVLPNIILMLRIPLKRYNYVRKKDGMFDLEDASDELRFNLFTQDIEQGPHTLQKLITVVREVNNVL